MRRSGEETARRLTGPAVPLSFALYVHVPFCRAKCAYCDFTSFEGREAEIPRYIEMLLKEWEAVREILLAGRPYTVTSCYFGGGTPSLLPESRLEILIQGLFPQGTDPGMEFSLEANPESLSAAKLACWRRLGINRVSLGVQSFSDAMLRRLGRIHTARQAEEAVLSLIRGGWENWSLDLMFGLPGQHSRDFERDLERALSYRPPHLSAYHLTLAHDTLMDSLAREGRLHLPGEDVVLAMMDILEGETAKAGLVHYETSNFARPGFACAHNLAYWRLRPYIGLGAGAVSYFEEGTPWGRHWKNPDDLSAYGEMAENGSWRFPRQEPLKRNEALAETFLTGLRLAEGVDMKEMGGRFGPETVREVSRKIRPLVAAGWLEVNEDALKATQKGRRVLDSLLLEILSDLE